MSPPNEPAEVGGAEAIETLIHTAVSLHVGLHLDLVTFGVMTPPEAAQRLRLQADALEKLSVPAPFMAAWLAKSLRENADTFDRAWLAKSLRENAPAGPKLRVINAPAPAADRPDPSPPK